MAADTQASAHGHDIFASPDTQDPIPAAAPRLMAPSIRAPRPLVGHHPPPPQANDDEDIIYLLQMQLLQRQADKRARPVERQKRRDKESRWDEEHRQKAQLRQEERVRREEVDRRHE